MTSNKKVQGEQEIFAYRVGEKLICPACHELSVKILAVHEIDPTPSKPLKREDVKGFICDHCGLIRGDYKLSSLEELWTLQEKLDLPDVTKVTKVSNVSNNMNISSDIGESNGKRRGRNLREKMDLQDMVQDCADKVAFLDDFFSHGHGPDTEFFSEDGKAGFHWILADLEDDLKFVVDGMEAIPDQEDNKSLKLAGKRTASAANGLLETIDIARATGKI